MVEEKHYCQCGCNQEIILTLEQIRRKRYPKYIKGHYKKQNIIFDRIYYCNCGCGQIIPWTKNQKYNRPSYILNHDKHLKKKKIIPIIIYCQCGCNKIIPFRENYIFKSRRPKYIKGHQNSLRNKKIPKITQEEFEETKPHNCKCGCGQEISWKNKYIYVGIPYYIHGHNNKGKKIDIEIYNKVIETKRRNGTLYPSLKSRENMSISHIGKKHTSEQCKKISDRNKGKPAWNKGKHLSPETCKKMSESRRGSKSPNWKGGISFDPYCEKFNEAKKEEIRNLYGRKCFSCDKDEKDNVMKSGRFCKLDVDHMDEDKQQGCNGKSWFLVPLCHSCHSKMQKNHNRQKILDKYHYEQLYNCFKFLYG